MSRVECALGFVPVDARRVLDVGCWTGEVTAAIARRTGGEVVGVDVLPDAVATARERHPGVVFEVRDVLRSPFPAESFDCITFLEVIEHVESPAAFLREFHRILKPGGVLVVSTPNAGSYYGPLRYFRDLKRKVRVIDREPRGTGTHTDHIYSWDLFTLYRLLHRLGFAYEEHGFAGVSLPGVNLDFLEGLVGRFSTSVVLAARKTESLEVDGS